MASGGAVGGERARSKPAGGAAGGAVETASPAACPGAPPGSRRETGLRVVARRSGAHVARRMGKSAAGRASGRPGRQVSERAAGPAARRRHSERLDVHNRCAPITPLRLPWELRWRMWGVMGPGGTRRRGGARRSKASRSEEGREARVRWVEEKGEERRSVRRGGGWFHRNTRGMCKNDSRYSVSPLADVSGLCIKHARRPVRDHDFCVSLGWATNDCKFTSKIINSHMDATCFRHCSNGGSCICETPPTKSRCLQLDFFM
jgi:hypothetical protein